MIDFSSISFYSSLSRNHAFNSFPQETIVSRSGLQPLTPSSYIPSVISRVLFSAGLFRILHPLPGASKSSPPIQWSCPGAEPALTGTGSTQLGEDFNPMGGGADFWWSRKQPLSPSVETRSHSLGTLFLSGMLRTLPVCCCVC